MSKETLMNRFAVLSITATVGAHADAQSKAGFRQRDVRRLYERFANWIEPGLPPEGIPIKNTQISRYLDRLSAEGLARKSSKQSKPHYSLTPLGLVDLMHSVVEPGYYPQKEQFFFLFTFIKNYRHRIREIVASESRRFPFALQLELEALFNPLSLLERQRYYSERELKKIEKRMNDQQKSVELGKKMLNDGFPRLEVYEEITYRFPYAAYSEQHQASAKTDELMLEHGLNRNDLLWKPIKEMLVLHLQQLSELEASEKKRSLL